MIATIIFGGVEDGGIPRLSFKQDHAGSTPVTATKPCAKCGVEPRLSYHSYCRGCHQNSVESAVKNRKEPIRRKWKWRSDYHKERYRKNRARLIEFKLSKGCADCGYRAHHAALQFDHLPGKLKKCSPVTLLGRGFMSAMKEIEKCDVVCSNCHSIRTWQRQQLSTSR